MIYAFEKTSKEILAMAYGDRTTRAKENNPQPPRRAKLLTKNDQ